MLLKNQSSKVYTFEAKEVAHGKIDRFGLNLPLTLEPDGAYLFEVGSSGFMTGAQFWAHYKDQSHNTLKIDLECSYIGVTRGLVSANGVKIVH
jgi:hypothetical protein